MENKCQTDSAPVQERIQSDVNFFCLEIDDNYGLKSLRSLEMKRQTDRQTDSERVNVQGV
jgi:hypothetical protein